MGVLGILIILLIKLYTWKYDFIYLILQTVCDCTLLIPNLNGPIIVSHHQFYNHLQVNTTKNITECNFVKKNIFYNQAYWLPGV